MTHGTASGERGAPHAIDAQTLADYFELLRFQTVSADPMRLVDISRCAAWLKRYLGKLGFDARIHLEGDQPIVIAERVGSPAAPSVLFYGHYDVQPADPLELWRTDPFEPQLIDGRVYARGAQDNKGQLFAFIRGVSELIAAGRPLPTLRLLLESQEESGSGALRAALPKIRRRLASSILLVGDTGMHSSGRFAITAGLRGLAQLTVELFGPHHDIHSGMHGGAAPNPARGMAGLIATLHDARGRVAVPGFYDGVAPPSAAELELARAVPFDAAAYLAQTGVAPVGGEEGIDAVERLGFQPTLEVNGIHSGYGGPGSKTIIPAKALAKITMRLVPGQSPEGVLQKVIRHLRDHTPRGLRLEIPDSSAHGSGVRLPVDSPITRLAADVLEELGGAPPYFVWEGASIPIVSELHNQLGAAPLLVGFGREEDRIHAPNESFSLEQFRLMMDFSAMLMARLAQGA